MNPLLWASANCLALQLISFLESLAVQSGTHTESPALHRKFLHCQFAEAGLGIRSALRCCVIHLPIA